MDERSDELYNCVGYLRRHQEKGGRVAGVLYLDANAKSLYWLVIGEGAAPKESMQLLVSIAFGESGAGFWDITGSDWWSDSALEGRCGG